MLRTPAGLIPPALEAFLNCWLLLSFMVWTLLLGFLNYSTRPSRVSGCLGPDGSIALLESLVLCVMFFLPWMVLSLHPLRLPWVFLSLHPLRCILEVFMKGTLVLHVPMPQMVLSLHLLRRPLGALYLLRIGLFPVLRHFKPVALCLWALTL